MSFEELINAMTKRGIEIEEIGLDHYGITYILEHYPDNTVDEKIAMILTTVYTITDRIHGEIKECKNYVDAMNVLTDIMETQDTCKIHKIHTFEYEIIK